MIRVRPFAALFATLAMLSPAQVLAWPHKPAQGVLNRPGFLGELVG